MDNFIVIEIWDNDKGYERIEIKTTLTCKDVKKNILVDMEDGEISFWGEKYRIIGGK